MSVSHVASLPQTDLLVNDSTGGQPHWGLCTSENPGADNAADAPLPRPARGPRRAKSDRGLATDEVLADLARAYLERQRKHWPEMAQAGLLPAPTDVVLHDMVEDFKSRHRTGEVAIQTVQGFTRFRCTLGGSYSRYSSDNSSPTSVLDQMVNELDKAKAEGVFVPWQYVFADYSITGLDASRQGYTAYKSLLSHKDHLIEVTFIDDFTRASRDALEWWKLAALSKRFRKGLIGASDGFNLNDPNSDIMITIYGLLSRLFIKGLKEKVRRGMKGAARRGTCLGKPSLGFTRKVQRDANGNVVHGPDGDPKTELCIDPVTREHRLLIFQLFVEQGWSTYKIARYCNQHQIDGGTRWTPNGVQKLLWNPDAVGIFIWNKTRSEYDEEKNRMVSVPNPKSEWIVQKKRHLALVPPKLWVAARHKILANRKTNPLTGRKPSRNQRSATTLFSGTLFCSYCGKELTLYRSGGDNKAMHCRNGLSSIRGCQLTTAKSTRIIENCLLNYLCRSVLTEPVIEGLVERANAFLLEEAQKPQVDAAPLKAQLRESMAGIQKLVQQVEKEPDDALCEGYHARIKQLQQTVNQLKEAIREAEVHNRKPPEPLDVDRVKTYLADLRALFQEEVPRAAEAIRALTGPIMIRHEPIPGCKQGAPWIASFSPDLLRLLHHAAKGNGYPEAATLATLPTETPAVEVRIEKLKKYELLAPMVKQLHDEGMNISRIAAIYGMAGDYAKQTLEFARTGQWPNKKRRKSN